MRYIATLFSPPGNLPDWSRCYDTQYVERFADSARRHDPDAEVVILTEEKLVERLAVVEPMRRRNYIVRTLIDGNQGWASLMEMFRPEIVGSGPALLCGLDTIFVGPTNQLEEAIWSYGLMFPLDPYDIPFLTNAVVGVTYDHAVPIWSKWERDRQNPATFTDPRYLRDGRFSEMHWLRYNCSPVRWFDEELPGRVLSYKRDVVPTGGPPLPPASVVYFHGEPKPHNLMHLPWVQRNWA